MHSSMQLDNKVLLGRLYERTSQKGNRYFGGRLGAARVMLFRDDYADDDNVLQLFVQESGEKGLQVAQEREGPPKMTPRVPGSGRRPSASQERPGNSYCQFSTIRCLFDRPRPDIFT